MVVLVCPTIFEAWIEFLLAAFETRHAIGEAHLNEMAFAYFFARECGEEVHEISVMVPLFHTSILSALEYAFCVSWVAIFPYDFQPVRVFLSLTKRRKRTCVVF